MWDHLLRKEGPRTTSASPDAYGEVTVEVDATLNVELKDIGELTVDVDGDAQVRIRCE